MRAQEEYNANCKKDEPTLLLSHYYYYYYYCQEYIRRLSQITNNRVSLPSPLLNRPLVRAQGRRLPTYIPPDVNTY